MKVRDSRDAVNGKFKTQVMPSGSLDIIADDGQTLFSLRLKDGVLEVSAGGVCKHADQVLNEGLTITPHYYNRVTVSRLAYTTP